MDAADQAQEMSELDMKVALQNLKRGPGLVPTGSCYYCDALVSEGLFCDAGCRDDYEIASKA